VCELLPIADRLAQHVEIISKNLHQAYQDSHGIYHLVLGTNHKSHGQNSGSLEKF